MLDFIKDLTAYSFQQSDDLLVGIDATLPSDTQKLLVAQTKRTLVCKVVHHNYLDEHESALS